ncbi:MAG: GFA family protein [Sulfitobacter sp.]
MNKIKGRCLCGAVSFEVANAFEKMFICSCDQCRQITGSAFASNLFVDIKGFDWLGGADNINIYQVPGRDISKSFCRNCGAGVPWKNGDGTKMVVPAGSLNAAVNVAERIRIFASELPSWASDLEHVTTYAKFPESLESDPIVDQQT